MSYSSNKNKDIRPPKNCRCAKIITTGQILHSWSLPCYRGHYHMVSVKFASGLITGLLSMYHQLTYYLTCDLDLVIYIHPYTATAESYLSLT